LSGESLLLALNSIIDNHTVYPYTSTSTDVWDILLDIDEDPNNSSNLLAFYTGISIPKECQDGQTLTGVCEIYAYGELQTIKWNREHIWSKSRGFPTESFDAYTDIHHLVASESWMNSTKNNRFFESCDVGIDTDIVDRGYGNYTCNEWSFEPRDEVKGDVARMIFYMMVRYYIELDLEIMDNPMDYLISLGEDRNSSLPIYGDLEDLLQWHIDDPVSQKEIDRNIAIYGYQGNRNPFIDYEHFVELIFGDYPYYS
jgi:endonuclease I